MASKYHGQMASKMPKLQYAAAEKSAGGSDASWVEAQRALKTLTPLSRVQLTLEDGRGASGGDGE